MSSELPKNDNVCEKLDGRHCPSLLTGVRQRMRCLPVPLCPRAPEFPTVDGNVL